jgi:hypothetical protein
MIKERAVLKIVGWVDISRLPADPNMRACFKI